MIYSHPDSKSLLQAFDKLGTDGVFIKSPNGHTVKFYPQGRADLIDRIIGKLEENIIGHFDVVQIGEVYE